MQDTFFVLKLDSFKSSFIFKKKITFCVPSMKVSKYRRKFDLKFYIIIKCNIKPKK